MSKSGTDRRPQISTLLWITGDGLDPDAWTLRALIRQPVTRDRRYAIGILCRSGAGVDHVWMDSSSSRAEPHA
jgi:hypothetical protein